MFDHVQSPRGKSWVTRNRIIFNGEPRWLTLPIHRNGKEQVAAIKINYASDFARKHLGMVRQAYGKTDYFDRVYPIIEAIYAERFERVIDFSIKTTELLIGRLGLSVEIISSIDLVRDCPNLRGLSGNSLVLETCIAAGGSDYVSGSGCLDFIKPESFESKGVSFYFQDFECRTYKQYGQDSFVSHMSILDALFNVGFERTAELVNQDSVKKPCEIE